MPFSATPSLRGLQLGDRERLRLAALNLLGLGAEQAEQADLLTSAISLRSSGSRLPEVAPSVSITGVTLG